MNMIKKEIIVSLIVIVITACITSIGLVDYHKKEQERHRKQYCVSAHACECKENEKTCTCSSYDLDGNEIHNVICPNNNIKIHE